MAQLKDLIVNGGTRLLNDVNVNGTIKQNGTEVSLSGHKHTKSDITDLGAAAAKEVDTSIAAASASTNLPTSHAVASFVEGKGYTTNTGTVTTTGTMTSSHVVVSNGGTIIKDSGFTIGKSVPSDAKFTDTVTTATTTGSGNAVTAISASNGALTVTKGTTFLTASDISGKANTSDVLTKTNTTSYTPSANYHPATKKYVDDQASNYATATQGTKADSAMQQVFSAGGTAPSNTKLLWIDTTNKVLKYYNGSAWVAVPVAWS